MSAVQDKETTEQPQEAVAPEPADIVNEDGLLIDAETGEIVGHEVPQEFEAEKDRPLVSQGFVDHLLSKIQRSTAEAKTYSSLAEALIEQRMERLAKIASEDPDIVVLDQRIESLMVQAKRADMKRSWLLDFYLPTFKAFAMNMLAGVKGRTWTSPQGFGKIALVSQPARLKVVDEAKAIETAKTLGWEGAVKETFLVSRIPADFQEELKTANRENAEAFGFEVVQEDDKVTVK